MMGISIIAEFTPNQRHAYEEAVAAHRSFLAAWRRSRPFKGGMHWKKIGGRAYLYRYRDRFGHGRSLGVRAEQTEALFAAFSRDRLAAATRLREARAYLAEQARFCRAARLNRVPRVAARVLRLLEQQERGGNFLVLGTSDLPAYEFTAGVFLDGSLPAQRAAFPRSLALSGSGRMPIEEVMQMLQQVDRSFAPESREKGLAVNRDGFRVRVLDVAARRAGKPRAFTVPGAGEPLPPEAGDLHYLTAAPKFSQVVVGQDGWPVTMTVPDPRAFAIHKLWLSVQGDRDEGQRSRDRRQALAVAAIILHYLPQYDFSSSEMAMFPPELAREAENLAGGLEATPENEAW